MIHTRHMTHVRDVKRIFLRDYAEGSCVLAGAPRGRRVLARLLECIDCEADTPEPVFLDFTDIDVATASFLREALLGFKDSVRQRWQNLYPVVANVNENVLDELKLLINARSDVLLTCSLDSDAVPHDIRIIGELEAKQKLTFNLVKNRGETDASELMRDHNASEGVKHQTAWNNRLAALCELGLIVELKQGRAKRYRPLLVES
jgi:hypothetical protein